MFRGDRLKGLRKKKGLTQGELADRLKIPRSTYSNYELSKREPDFETTVIIADFFDVSTDFLAGRDVITNEKLTPVQKEFIDLIKNIQDPETLKSLMDIAKKISN